MQLWILLAGFAAIISLIAMFFNMAKQKGIDEQIMLHHEIVLEDKKNDQEITARPDDSANDLLDRMFTEND